MNTIENTIRLYYTDSHLTTFQAEVLTCTSVKDHYEIVLNQTAFFPEGGGQPADQGIFLLPDQSTATIFDVHEKGDIIYHYSNSPVTPGTQITGTIDWDYRFSLMQHHSGEHIVSGLVHAHHKFNNIGFHMGSDAVTMDFDGFLTEDDLHKIEVLANGVVYKNLPIQTTFPNAEELNQMQYRSKKELSSQVRIVEIPGYDICACCAPHVNYTGEVGLIKLISAIKYKGGTRVSMLCGSKALDDYYNKSSQINDISTLLSLKPNEVSEGVKRLKEEYHSVKGNIIGLNQELLQYKVKEFPEGTRNICIIDDKIDASSLRNYCNLLLERCTGIVAVFTGTDNNGYKYILGSRESDIRPIGNELNKLFSGRGGGSKEMVQGSLSGSKQEIETFMMEHIG